MARASCIQFLSCGTGYFISTLSCNSCTVLHVTPPSIMNIRVVGGTRYSSTPPNHYQACQIKLETALSKRDLHLAVCKLLSARRLRRCYRQPFANTAQTGHQPWEPSGSAEQASNVTSKNGCPGESNRTRPPELSHLGVSTATEWISNTDTAARHLLRKCIRVVGECRAYTSSFVLWRRRQSHPAL